jgi:Skp family chaperone for outer membrane proteins
MFKQLAAASLLTLAAGGLPAGGFAQEAPAAIPFDTIDPLAQSSRFQSQVLTINQQRLFEESDFGKSSLSRLEKDSRGLQAEIRKIESDLEIEERLLTERRATLSPDDFQPLARAFDDKVEKIRAAWGAKDRDLKRQREQDQQTFFESAVPILADLMQEMGAVLLVDQSSVILSLDRVDITQTAMDRINARLSSPTAPEANPESGSDSGPTADPAPETAPKSDPQKP